MNKKHAYLFIVAGNLKILEKSLILLDSENNDFYIHLDIKCNDMINELNEVIKNLKSSKVFLINEIDVRWGDFSQVECELLLLRNATNKYEYEYYHLLSESDMPIKSQKEILEFFEKNKGKEFVEIQELPKSKLFLTRFKTYNIFTRQLKAKNKIIRIFTYVIRKIFAIIQLLFGYDYTKKFNMEIKYGSNWFSITDNLARYILENEELIRKMFSHGICVDEHFMQTLVYNSKYKKDLYKDGNLRLIVWEKNNNSPNVLTIKDYNKIMNSNKLFARKFKEDVDMDIVDKIYKNIKEK